MLSLMGETETGKDGFSSSVTEGCCTCVCSDTGVLCPFDDVRTVFEKLVHSV